jgi:iron-regulated transporter 1
MTRFGDQAWDFAVPLVLIGLFPGELQIVAFYFLVIKLVQFFLTPSLINTIDRWERKKIFQIGIGSQTLALIFSWFLIVANANEIASQSKLGWGIFSFLILLGVVSSIGSSLMEVSVGFDLAVDYLKKEELPIFNSRMKRIDLLTEVSAPFAAGLLLLLSPPEFRYMGLTIIALMNLVSFIPEYLLLQSVIGGEEHQEKRLIQIKERLNPIKEFAQGMSYFKDQKYAIPMIAYALLWLSVLSPHGVLLAGYLKDTAKISETEIGIFRGFGALFGLVPTFLYAKLHARWGLQKAANSFLGFQALCVSIAAISFFSGNQIGLYIFLIFILFSRCGLYGFGIAETEVRQKLIPADIRGRVNGFGVSLTSFATLFIFLVGSLLPSSADFKYLVFLSAGCVISGFLLLQKWRI